MNWIFYSVKYYILPEVSNVSKKKKENDILLNLLKSKAFLLSSSKKKWTQNILTIPNTKVKYLIQNIINLLQIQHKKLLRTVKT